MTDLTVLIGMPGAGKTAWARHHAAGALVASSDRLREERFGTNQDHSADEEIDALRDRLVLDALAVGRSVVVEDGFMTAKRRLYLKAAKEAGARAHVVFFANHAQAQARNAVRTKRRAPDFLSPERMAELAAEVRVEPWDSVMWISGYDLRSADRGGCSK